MELGINEQGSRRHSYEYQHLRQINEVLKLRHKRKKEDGREREKDKTELGIGRPGKGSAPEVDSTVQE